MLASPNGLHLESLRLASPCLSSPRLSLSLLISSLLVSPHLVFLCPSSRLSVSPHTGTLAAPYRQRFSSGDSEERQWMTMRTLLTLPSHQPEWLGSTHLADCHLDCRAALMRRDLLTLLPYKTTSAHTTTSAYQPPLPTQPTTSG